MYLFNVFNYFLDMFTLASQIHLHITQELSSLFNQYLIVELIFENSQFRFFQLAKS